MKKKFILLLTFITLLFITACGEEAVVEPDLQTVRSALVIPTEVTDYDLPILVDGVSISWSSNISGTLSEDFEIIQGLADTAVSLTASFSVDDKVLIKSYNTTIIADPNLAAATVNIAKTNLTFPSELDGDIVLETTIGEVTVTWATSNSDYLSTTGEVTRPLKDSGNETVTLTATLTLLDITNNSRKYSNSNLYRLLLRC